MIVALLFNWNAYDHEHNYWHAVRKTVFSTGIIQRSGRHMKLAIGDVLTGLRSSDDPRALYLGAFASRQFRLVDDDRLMEGFPTIFGMVFENMTRELASDLHEALQPHGGYLGAVSVHLEYPPHLTLFRARIPPHYRLEGRKLRSFYAMGVDDGCDPDDLEDMKKLGYDDVEFEDTGASRTILDDFDTPRHFGRVACFRELLTETLPGGEDDAYQLVMLLEDLSPRLFNALGAAAERLVDAENEEEVAQAAVSGRRYLEQLADALFPPSEASRGGRRLTREHYRNRLWAFVEDRTVDEEEARMQIGAEIDRVAGEFNAGLHGDCGTDRMENAIRDAALLTATLFGLDPGAVRNGYLAYMDGVRAFARELVEQRENPGR